MEDLRKQLGIEDDKPIPADYNIPYFVHQENMNRMDMSHKRVEKWLVAVCIVIFVALIGTNGYWIWNESQYEDVVTTVTQEATSDGGSATINGDNAGAVFYGESKTDGDN